MSVLPTIVYVSGAPGSGKTTLAKLLSEELYIPHVSSDLIHGGVAIRNPRHNREQTLKNAFVPLMINMAEKGVSFVADHVLQEGVSERDVIQKLRPHARIIYVHTETKDPIDRYINRIKSSKIPNIVERRDHLLSLATKHKENLKKTNQPLNLDLPTLVVNTDDGYDPGLEDIVSFVKNSV